MSLATNTRLGPYEILAQLGAGGMGEVYRAQDERLERDVAIKVLPEKFAKDDLALARFQREVRAIAGLSHPNIVAIYDVGTSQGQTYAVMELLEGQTLGKRIRQGRLDWREAVDWATAIGEGLAAAHAKGIIHRDIKPDNIFLTKDGGLKILDFGLARLERTAARLPAPSVTTPALDTEPGMVMGTILYMSPEQVRGQPADGRSDIFALGNVLYEMLQGRRPFERPTGADTMAAILNEPIAHLSDVDRPRLPELEAIVVKCLEKSPERRFQSARALVQALKDLVRGLPTPEPPGMDQQETAMFNQTSVPESRHPVRDPPSVAVLPFRNLSSDPENEYFSDGLAEELINALTRVEGLQVASRTSAFAFKNRNEDIRKIGEQLNVRTVLEGSVRKSGQRLRISAQLIKVANGYHLWSQSYNRELADVFAIQEEIATSIAAALQVLFGDCAKKAIAKCAAADVKAYDCYLRGMQFFHQFRRQGFELAEQMFAQAIAIDPRYARAHAGVANCHSLLFTYWDHNPEHLAKACEASRTALDLDTDLAEAHFARGLAVASNKQFAEARREFETAILLDPTLFEAHYYYYGSALLTEGKLEQAAKLFDKAHALRPEDYQAVAHLGGIYATLGRANDARAACQLALNIMRSQGRAIPQHQHGTGLRGHQSQQAARWG